ncbi:MAG: short-chain dehydrogenase/reductase [Xanthomonadaceae bacterium]|nr:short-chain dehydrogenase/reductase [Xanthomonadaceae bacterium]
MTAATNRVALVTGASSGIGEATARQLIAAGWRVYAGARRVDRMQPLAAAGARLLALDVTDEASMQQAVDTIRRDEGRLDVLVNNAGYGAYGALEEVPLDEGRRQFEVNVFGLARLTQLVLPMMRARRSGRIVNITSIGGKIGEPFGSWYHATKFAVEGLSDSLRMELHPFGIDVVIIEPGAIKTEWNGIARDGLMKHSGDGPYRDGAREHVKMLASADRGAMPSPPDVVARTIVRAVQAARPKTRYATGGGAQMVLFLRRVLSDRAFDATMRLFSKQAARSMP